MELNIYIYRINTTGQNLLMKGCGRVDNVEMKCYKVLPCLGSDEHTNLQQVLMNQG